MQCIVCKQKIQENEPKVDTPQGPVHQGQCQQHLSEMAMNESSGSVEDVQLLV